VSRSIGNQIGFRLLIVVTALLVLATAAAAQRVRVQREQPPHYVGDFVLVRITADQFDADQPPTCTPGPMPDGILANFVKVEQSRREWRQIINGVLIEHSVIAYIYDYHVVADHSGTFQISPFTVKQNGKTATTEAFVLKFNVVPVDRRMRIALDVPSGPLYTGQRVPVTIEWSYDAADFNNIITNRLYIRSPLFDLFNFEDEPVSRGDNLLPIVTDQGIVNLKAKVSNRDLDGREFFVVTATRMVNVEKPGVHDLPAITANVERVTKWGQTLLGGRRPVSTTRISANGSPRKLVIESIPLVDAPPGFGGAVGRGFVIDVKAGRSVVRVGDPIDLTVTVRGDADLESVGLPSLTSAGAKESGLDPKKFRIPEEQPSGTILEGGRAKQFVVPVRVLSDSVTTIPPIAYSWFDPDRRKFETTRSDPIAMQVERARMVGAADVENSAGESPTSDDGSGGVAVEPKQVEPVEHGSFDLTGADLAIATDPHRLLVNDHDRFGGTATHAAIYIASMVLVLAAWWRRRAAEVDPQDKQRRRMVNAQVRQITRASTLPQREAAGQIAAALRHIAPHADASQRGQIDHLLSECDLMTYAREAESTKTIDLALHERAASVAQIVAKEAK